jgi:N-acetyl-beta-hexosaminidase
MCDANAARRRLASLLPHPVSVMPTDGCAVLGRSSVLSGDPANSEVMRRILAPATGFVLPDAAAVTAGDRDLPIIVGVDEALPPEGYRLDVDTVAIHIEAGSAAGLNWAAQTLRQLLPMETFLPAPRSPGGGWHVPCVRIRDAPRFGWRGVLLDVARHFMPLPWLTRFVDLLAAQKHNVLQLHLSDDEGWRIKSLRHPELIAAGAWRDDTAFPGQRPTGRRHGGYYTQDQLRALVRYAGDRGITIVPEVDFPGHAGAFLRAFPQHAADSAGFDTACWREVWHPIDLSDAAVELVLDIYDEVLTLFDSPTVHIGGDEADRTLWRADPSFAELAARRGLTGVDGLQPWFTRTVAEWLLARGRRPVGWDEILDDADGADPLPEGTAVMAWRSVEKGIAAAEAGHPVIMSPASATYLDHPQAPGERDVPQWGDLLTWQQVYAFDPCAGLSAEAAERVLGTQVQLWTEYLPDPHAVEYAAFPRSGAHAEVAWVGPERDETAFAARLAAYVERLGSMGVEYRPLAGPAPWQ